MIARELCRQCAAPAVPRQVRTAGRAWGLIFLVSVAYATGMASHVVAGGFDRAIDRATQCVVKLYGVGMGRQSGFGTGVLVSPDGLVVTVFSLLLEARSIRAVDFAGRRYEAEVIDRDTTRQLALLRLRSTHGGTPGPAPGHATAAPENPRTDSLDESPNPLSYFDLTQEVNPHPGDWVVASGNAFKVAEGDEMVSIAHGVFSARTLLDARRRTKDFPYQDDVLVIDAITSNPGSPGGALVNLDGQFLGMIGRVVTSNFTHTHFNYAIPRDVLLAYVREVTDPIARSAAVASRQASATVSAIDPGIRLARVGYQQVLPFVDRVVRDSQAARAGVRKDDLILSVNGKSVRSADDYDARIRALRPGEPIDLAVRRGKRIVAIRIEPEVAE